ncbi:MAG: hypothetical protein ISS71_06705 [Phycisphaerae bacterium]|nr:hypothetical protein [Phycisphaerae bacterium]
MINGEEKLKKMLEELLDEIGDYPNAVLKKEIGLKSRPLKHSNQTEKALSSVQESVDNMRICIKYLLFDLDATRRENLYYKKLLEDKET